MAHRSRPAQANVYRAARSGPGQPRSHRPVAAWFGLAGLRGFACLPYPAIYRVAGVIGRGASRLPIRIVRHADVTVRLCFPDLDETGRRRLVRDSLAESARAVCEVGALWTWPRDRVLGLVRDVRGLDVLDDAVRSGRGVLLAGPHLGSWEMAGLYCSARHPITAIYRQPAVSALERLYASGRARFGATLVPGTPGGLRVVVRALESGGVVAFIPDQNPHRGAGVFAPYFGVPANTTTFVSRLVARTGARVVVGFAERLPRGEGFCLHFAQASPDVYDPDLLVSATALNRDIEQLVRRCPEQYLWSYKRFSVRPPGEPNPYRMVADAGANH